VDGGGNLLITGPVERNEHWQTVSRAAELFSDVDVQPLTFNNALQGGLDVFNGGLPLTFDQDAQSWLAWLRFADGVTFKEKTLGKGRLEWTSYPVELSGNEIYTSSIYVPLSALAATRPRFETHTPLERRAGVLIYPLELEDSVLYVFASDSAENENIEIRDTPTGVSLQFTLPAQHAAMALIGKKEKAVIAKYGF
jgi:hypothetical protein